MDKYLVGSYGCGISNNHDYDYLAIVDGDDTVYRHEYTEEHTDVFVRSKPNIDKTMLFRLPFTNITVRYYMYNYQLDKEIIGQDFPLEYHILDRRKDYIALLNYIVDNKCLNFKKIPRYNHGNCSKLIYHIAYLTFILENNSTTLTAEQKAIVQKIHDKQMPQDYLDVLEEKIRKLKENN